MWRCPSLADGFGPDGLWQEPVAHKIFCYQEMIIPGGLQVRMGVGQLDSNSVLLLCHFSVQCYSMFFASLAVILLASKPNVTSINWNLRVSRLCKQVISG